MKRLTETFTSSFRELKQVRTITVCAMLAAIGVILGSLTIYITDTVRIGFAGIPNMLAAYLFGPVAGGVFAGALDILKHLVKPMGPFMPALTLSVVLKGLLYGCAFYKKPISLWRVLAIQLVVAVVCNLFLNTWALSLLYGKAFLAMLIPRIMRNLVMWPIDSLIFYHVAKILEVTGVFRILGRSRAAI